MKFIDTVILTNETYALLCFVAGTGWGLFAATLFAAVTIDRIKWSRWVSGR